MTNVQSIVSLNVISVLAIASACLIGCADQDVAKPSEITLDDALKQVGTGLVAMKAAEVRAATNAGMSSNFNQGLMPSSVVVSFNIAASQNNSNQLMVAASTPKVSPVTANGSEAFSSSASGSRANSITITYSSLYFNSGSSSSTNKPTSSLNNPADVAAMTQVILANATNGAGSFAHIESEGTPKADK